MPTKEQISHLVSVLDVIGYSRERDPKKLKEMARTALESWFVAMGVDEIANEVYKRRKAEDAHAAELPSASHGKEEDVTILKGVRCRMCGAFTPLP